MLFTILLIVHILVCVALVVVVLLQSAKGEGLAGAFGGGGGLSGAVFGGRGAASFLSKATTILAVLFMVSCMGLSLLSSSKVTGEVINTGSSAVTDAAQRDMQQGTSADQAPGTTEQVNPEDIFDAGAGEETPETP